MPWPTEVLTLLPYVICAGYIFSARGSSFIFILAVCFGHLSVTVPWLNCRLRRLPALAAITRHLAFSVICFGFEPVAGYAWVRPSKFMPRLGLHKKWAHFCGSVQPCCNSSKCFRIHTHKIKAGSIWNWAIKVLGWQMSLDPASLFQSVRKCNRKVVMRYRADFMPLPFSKVIH